MAIMKKNTVNDVTQLNPITVREIAKPSSVAELQQLIKSHTGPVSFGGGRYSMGGQIATDNTLFIDMTGLNAVTGYDPAKKEITVQAGARWQDVIARIDPDDLSVSIMQSYSNFTVGGALGVNAHGRYIGQGPVIRSVKEIKIVTADGDLKTASPAQNSELFYGAIGGYGALGAIVEAKLDLADNVNVARSIAKMPRAEYAEFFDKNIRGNADVVFHNCDFYPPDYDTITAVTYTKTDKPATVPDRLRPKKEVYLAEYLSIFAMTQVPGVNKLRPMVDEKIRFKTDEVVPRNFEASRYVEELEPSTRAMTTFVLQEYFVPADKLDEFAPKMAAILQKHDVNALNVSIRHAEQDPGAVMAWAQQGDVFAFVLYYKQWNNEEARQKVGTWTRELVDAALESGGTYYLPYQMHATDAQFKQAYPRSDEFFALKQKYDPDNKFRNRLWDKYDPNGPKIDPETPQFRREHTKLGQVKKKFAEAVTPKKRERGFKPPTP